MANKKVMCMCALWIVLALMCVIYGVVVRAAGSGTSFFLVWIGMAVVFVILAYATKIDLWSKLPVVLRWITLGGICLGLCFFIFVEGCIVSQFDEKGESKLDYIIVLGAQVYERGPSVVLKYRLDSAIEYLNENQNTKCIVTGGQGYNEPFPEAEGMAKYLIENGINQERILLEKESTTTEENISNSMEMIEDDAKVGIVTNDFHLFRALQIAQKQGLSDASGIAAHSSKKYLPNNMLREFLAMIKFWSL